MCVCCVVCVCTCVCVCVCCVVCVCTCVCVCVCVSNNNRQGNDYCNGENIHTIRESENLDGSRFMRQEYVKLIFREEPGNGMPSWLDEDGVPQGKWLSNDMQLTYVLRKYAGRKSFVLPCAGMPDMCVDSDWTLGIEGMTTKGTRVLVRRDYIHRMYMRGAKQVWTSRLRQHRKHSIMVFAHSRTHAIGMARLRRELHLRGVAHVYVTITGHVGGEREFWSADRKWSSARGWHRGERRKEDEGMEKGGEEWGGERRDIPCSGVEDEMVKEKEMLKIFGWNQSDEENQRLEWFSLKIGFDYRRAHMPHSIHTDTLNHLTEVLQTTQPLLICLPLARNKWKERETGVERRERETEEAAIKGAELAAEYAHVPIVWIKNPDQWPTVTPTTSDSP